MDGANTLGSRIVWKDGMPRSQKSQENNNGHSRSGINALPTFDGDAVNIVVETPKGGRAKMKYDEKADLFRFEKLLPLGQAFPFDFGFFQSTTPADANPLPHLLTADNPTPALS